MLKDHFHCWNLGIFKGQVEYSLSWIGPSLRQRLLPTDTPNMEYFMNWVTTQDFTLAIALCLERTLSKYFDLNAVSVLDSYKIQIKFKEVPETEPDAIDMNKN